MEKSVHTHIYTHVHAHAHTYAYAHIHTHNLFCKCSKIQVSCSNIITQCSNISLSNLSSPISRERKHHPSEYYSYQRCIQEQGASGFLHQVILWVGDFPWLAIQLDYHREHVCILGGILASFFTVCCSLAKSPNTEHNLNTQFNSIQSLSCVQLFETPWAAARQAFLSSPIPEFIQTHVH